ncbi:transcription factor LBX2-like [Xenopus laevis]|uniref:Transcription factor LBX2-like n=1 Tax=Xenopus laevis TaxID=8355 RepID=A0A8J0U5M7_XENLA|nr:transcription factor LBX2-like [Xenopus laevis]
MKRQKRLMDPPNKSLTPFSIADILNKCPPQQLPPTPQSSPLSALLELTSKTFQGLDFSLLTPGRETPSSFGHCNGSKKRRKSRTAFTNRQIYELEKRFLYQKYLSPVDRDHIAQQLGLSNAQVITWFQNRRAKLKRDLDEMKADVESLKKLPPHSQEKLVSVPVLGVTGGDGVTGRGCCPKSRDTVSQPPQCCLLDPTGDEFSDEEEIDVDD